MGVPIRCMRAMNYEEILQFIQTTDARGDWVKIDNEWAEEAFLKEDPRLRVRTRFDDVGKHNDDFRDEWVNKFPNKRARSYWYELLNDGALIERFILVSVDGARAELPLPKLDNLQVKKLDYKIAEIFDSTNTLSDYMDMAGLSVEHT